MTQPYAHKPTESKYLHDLAKPIKYGTPLKRSMSGYEIELCLIDEQGDVSNSADQVMQSLKRLDKGFPIVKEVAKNFIEVNALPHSSLQKSAGRLIDNMGKVHEILEKQGLFVLPFGSYPGTFKEAVRKDQRYRWQQVLFTKNVYHHFFPRCFGFHYHYAMPKGTFNMEKGMLNNNIYSKTKTTLIDSYNFMVAADPVITTLAQSSPFESNRYRAKDTRMLYWRGGRKLKAEGIGTPLQMLFGLQPYKQTMADLISTIRKKDLKVRKMLIKAGAPKAFVGRKHVMDFMWNPVKVNKIGTLEHRGMDTNYLDVNLGITVMLKFILRAIQQEFYHVIPSDFALEEPFKLEGNVIFIPPHTHVRNELQVESAYKGFQSEAVSKSVSRFYKLARKLVYKEYVPALRTIKGMIDKKRTLSDQLVSYVRKKGHSIDEPLPKEVTRGMALLHAKKMIKEMDRTKRIYENLD